MFARPTRKGIAASLATLAVLGVAVACVNNSDRQSNNGSVNSGRVDIRQAYLQYWSALITANAIPDPNSALLAEHAASRQLTLLRRNLVMDVKLGLYASGTVRHDIRSISTQGQDAYVVDCVDINGWLLYSRHTKATISQLRSRPRQLAIYTLAPAGPVWKVTDSTVSGDC